MLVFRSEEHLQEWFSSGHPKGESMTLKQQWDLALLWFTGRADPHWRKRTAAEAEVVFRSVGLTSDFWRLT